VTPTDSSLVAATNRYSVVHLPRFWHVACLARELGKRPVGRTVLGIPLALFRDGLGRAVAVLDRCPHRNMPLSLGERRDGLLECRYHGWRFDGNGICRAVPGLTDDGTADRVARRVPSFPTIERDGFVWVVPGMEAPLEAEPMAMPHIGTSGYASVWRSRGLSATVHAAVENALDVPHTAFLHRGLFRGRRTPVPVEVTVRQGPGQVEAVYEGEPVPPGLAARVLAPEGGVVEHVDRFILPSIAQVEYRLGDSHLIITSAFTPVSDFETRLHAVVTFRLRVPTALVRAVGVPIADRILRQDAWVLRHQTDNVRRFGGEAYASTPIDVLGPHILRLMRRAARGEVDSETPRGPAERVTLLT
jgi:phenylpropionate dioxygenase-like ring-hydroxylating dioxygenase large terminal subunit